MRGSRSINRILIKKLLIFLAFELVFTSLTMPLLLVYGPFDQIKKTFVGMSWNTLRHQYIARFFLSDEAIHRILDLENSISYEDPGNGIEEIDYSGKDDSIKVYEIKGSNLRGKMLIISNPTRVAVGYSSLIPKAGETTSSIARRNNAIAAINAGGFFDRQWAGTGGAPMGFIIHQGKVIYNSAMSETVKQDTVAFTKKGTLIVGKHSIEELKRYGVWEGVSFGPPLVVNGKPTIKSGDGGWGIAPRTAIGQRKDGSVVFLVIDGRDVLRSFGATLRDVQDIMLQNGVVTAANLDGGSSTTMYYKGKVINRPSDTLGERTVPSVFMVLPGGR